MTTRSLVVKATAGADAPERCAQAFTVAATAAAAGASGVAVAHRRVGLVRAARPGREFDLPHSAPLPDLLAAVLAAGTVTAVHPVRGPARDRAGRRHRRAYASPARPCSSRSASPTAPRRWSTDRP